MLADILLAVVILLLLNRWAKKRFGVSYWVVFKNFWTGRTDKIEELANLAQAHNDGHLSYQLLFERFCKVTHMDPLDAFKTARDHMGFGFSDDKVAQHFRRYTKSNGVEIPNYVEAFLDQGKDYIINA